MKGRCRYLAGGFILVTGALLSLAAGPGTARAWDWPSHIHVGPEPYPIPEGPNVSSFWKREPPDWGPYPQSSYHWPTFREALDQYGWFGHRAGSYSPPAYPALPPGAAPATVVPSPEILPMPKAQGTAVIRVLVPARAAVWFDGHPTAQAGTDRLFQTPPLPAAGNNTYVIRVGWPQGGKQISSTRTVQVHPGERLTVDFVHPELAGGSRRK
jgi:uncharacterized protein (TIGR03000 family)